MAQRDRSNSVRPSLGSAHFTLGSILKSQGKIEEALAEFTKAIVANPEDIEAGLQAGLALIDMGLFSEAVERFEQVLQQDPNHVAANVQLGNLALEGHYHLSAGQRDRIETLVSSGRLAPAECGHLEFLRGALLEEQAQYDEAFECYRRANETLYEVLSASESPFEASECRRVVDEMLEVYEAEFFTGDFYSAHTSEAPVFVVGMPRSGTTLVEQIIASHPEAVTAGELPDIAKLATELPGSSNHGAGHPASMLELTRNTKQELADSYLATLMANRCGERRIVDKAPSNFLFLGFIRTILPRASIILCQRDASDVCLSCYTNCFKNVAWSWRLQDIGAFYAQYERLVAHWKQIPALRVHEVRYEQLVARPEETSRQLINACGLDWDDACLKFHANRGVIRTASQLQARKPIYNSSVGRWRNFRKHLAPLQAFVHP